MIAFRLLVQSLYRHIVEFGKSRVEYDFLAPQNQYPKVDRDCGSLFSDGNNVAWSFGFRRTGLYPAIVAVAASQRCDERTPRM
ncbi:MAG: hypothetical protein WBD25_12475 [Terriglobales bacterium]